MTQIEQKAFPLRLPVSLKTQASEYARNEGTSLNNFISLAVAEKIARMQGAVSASTQQSFASEQKRRPIGLA
jgi:hypothetical protein